MDGHSVGSNGGLKIRVFQVTRILRCEMRNGSARKILAPLFARRKSHTLPRHSGFEFEQLEARWMLHSAALHIVAADSGDVAEETVHVESSATAWQNPDNRLDIDGDGSVLPKDALYVQNS